MIRAEKVKTMKNYLLYVTFSDGDRRIYNCYPLLQYPIFSRLKEESFFRTVHVDDMGVVCWDDATDLPPDELYNNSESVESIVKVS